MTRAPHADQSFVAALAKVRAEPAVTLETVVADREYWQQIKADLAAAQERVRVLESALREIELHHVAMNIRRGRPIEHSRTLSIVRAALAGTPIAADPVGEWTREPPGEAGWYWVRELTTGYTCPAIVAPRHVRSELQTIERWSIPIPPPEGK